MSSNLIFDDSSAKDHHDAQFYGLLNAQLTRAKKILTELTTLAESMYKDSHSTACVNRLAWLRKKTRARKLQAELKDTRETLHMLLCVKTTQVLSNPYS